jgi:hypothetical protein
MPRYLSKSRFKLALSCPTKLYYTGKELYPDTSSDDSFLEALAEGGYQVGALAKCYYPEGIDIVERGYEESLRQTNELLKRENVVIFEAAFLFENLFIRADIIEKKGNRISLIEVKAKSFGGRDSRDMLSKKGYLDSEWIEYVYDVAFQKFVISKAFPEFQIHAYLMLADKNREATVNGLNQKFQLKSIDDDRTVVEIVDDVFKESLGNEVLIRVNVDDLVEMVYQGTDTSTPRSMSFVEQIRYFADHYERDEKIITSINKDCKSCEFRASAEQENEGKISGFKTCWSEQLGWDEGMFNLPRILDIWDFRKKNELMAEGKYLMRDLLVDEIGDPKPNTDGTLSRVERQWMQVRKAVDGDNKPFLDIDGLNTEFRNFKFPLHFIDFETSMVAIPFFIGRKPYEQTAFQFSHHVVYEDLTIEHKGQYLCSGKGKFPNFEFVQALKAELDDDDGSVFRYAAHENTVLNQILKQLQDSDIKDIQDKEELISFIQSINHGANHQGERDMIDLLELVKKYYYHPAMGGSNSLKFVLPAVLNSSEFIQTKYSEPIYGKASQIRSLNFDDGWVWLQNDGEGRIMNPYKLLPPIFEGIDDEQIEEFAAKNRIQDGGAAMTAYARMQFMQTADAERERIAKGLLKYCELDTLAMVMIWEYWNERINNYDFSTNTV